MTQSEESSTNSATDSGTPDPADADAASERPSVRWAHIEPVRVGWIVDGQRGFLDAGARYRVFGGDGVVEVGTSEAAAALTRAVEWMARQVPRPGIHGALAPYPGLRDCRGRLWPRSRNLRPEPRRTLAGRRRTRACVRDRSHPPPGSYGAGPERGRRTGGEPGIRCSGRGSGRGCT